MIYLKTPLTKKVIRLLKAGDVCLLTGEVYTARDQAHKKLIGLLHDGKRLPINIKEATLYYCGPTPAPKGSIIGSCGPTTSSRMDPFTPYIIGKGLLSMIGKGDRSEEVARTIKQKGAVYFLTYGGCGAYLNERVTKKEVIAFPELGTEAIYKLTVKDFPLIVATDTKLSNSL